MMFSRYDWERHVKRIRKDFHGSEWFIPLCIVIAVCVLILIAVAGAIGK